METSNGNRLFEVTRSPPCIRGISVCRVCPYTVCSRCVCVWEVCVIDTSKSWMIRLDQIIPEKFSSMLLFFICTLWDLALGGELRDVSVISTVEIKRKISNAPTKLSLAGEKSLRLGRSTTFGAAWNNYILCSWTIKVTRWHLLSCADWSID